MTNNYIFAIGEDGTLSIFNNIEQIRRSCEGIDVESCVWDFYNNDGQALKPVFNTPNITKKHLFGLFTSITSSQDFDLEQNKTEPPLQSMLTKEIKLEQNDYFEDISSINTYLTKN